MRRVTETTALIHSLDPGIQLYVVVTAAASPR